MFLQKFKKRGLRMKKLKWMSLLCAGVLVCSLAACGKGNSAGKTGADASAVTEDASTVDVENAVYHDKETGFVVNEYVGAYNKYADDINVFAMALSDEENIFYASVYCYRVAEEDGAEPSGCTLADIWYATDQSTTEESIVSCYNELIKATGSPEDMLWENCDIEKMTTPSGKTLYVSHTAEEGSIIGNPSEEELAEYDALRKELDAQLSQIDYVEPMQLSASEDTSFTTVDIDGNAVDSSIFANADYTLVNIWGSFCSPCIAEMPELMELNDEMDNVQVITVLGDATSPEDDTADDGRDIIESLNLTLPVLLSSDSFKTAFPNNYFPTSYLVDSNGKALGSPMVGGSSKEEYKEWIEQLINQQ